MCHLLYQRLGQPVTLDGLVDDLERVADARRRMDDAIGGGTLLPSVREDLRLVVAMLDNAVYTEEVGKRLHAVAAEFGRLAGFLAYDSNQPAIAQRYFIAALYRTPRCGDARDRPPTKSGIDRTPAGRSSAGPDRPVAELDAMAAERVVNSHHVELGNDMAPTTVAQTTTPAREHNGRAHPPRRTSGADR